MPDEPNQTFTDKVHRQGFTRAFADSTLLEPVLVSQVAGKMHAHNQLQLLLRHLIWARASGPSQPRDQLHAF